MYALATCTASVLRGISVNDWGDEQDAGTVIASGLICSITETSARGYDPSTQTPRVVRGIEGVLPSTTDITETDQLRDDTHGITYAIEAVSNPGTAGRATDLVLQLRRIT